MIIGAPSPPPLLQATLDLGKRLHRRQALRHAGIGFALLPDGGEELAILQFDAIHRYIDLGHIDRAVIAVEQIVVTADIRALVADVAEESSERPVVVE